jgi:CHAT domain-containing protein
VLLAGARHVVVSLWPVDDVAGCLLMAELYRTLPEHGIAGGLAAAAREVARWSYAEQRDRYRALCGQLGVAPEAGGTRDAVPAGTDPAADAGLPFFWAPFVHVGV